MTIALDAGLQPHPLLGIGVALGVGLLIGVEREQSHRLAQHAASAGVRTFALAALAGALGKLLANPALIAIGGLAVTGFAALAYMRTAAEEDGPGFTTELALVVTYLLGALAMEQAEMTAGIAVIIASLLAAKVKLRRFSTEMLSPVELRDALLLAAAALIVLPLLPDRTVDPLQTINPQRLWLLAVMVMTLNAGGYVATRLWGERIGTPMAGLFGGFVSSIATIASMGARARDQPEQMAPCVAAATLSSVSTVVELGLLLAVTDWRVAVAASGVLTGAAFATIASGIVYARQDENRATDGVGPAGRPFHLLTAVGFAALMATAMVVVAVIQRTLGATGTGVAVALAGFIDSHAPAVSVASLVRHGEISPAAAVLPILAALTTNTISKWIAAYWAGGSAFAWRLAPGLLAMLAGMWLPLLLARA